VAAPEPPTCAPWTTPERVRECCGGLAPDYDLTYAIQFVSSVLYRLSGRKYPGACERVIWPCRGDNCGCNGSGRAWSWPLLSGYPSYPVRKGGGWENKWGCCGGDCKLPCLDLPSSVNEITEVVIGGEVLDPSAYRIKAYRQLCRVDGGTWPCSNRLSGDECVTTDEVLSFAVDATGGQWSVVVALQNAPSGFVAFEATDTAAAIEAALWTLLGDNAVTVSGGPGDAGATSPYVMVFDVRTLGEVPVVSAVNDSLVGGDASVTTTTVQDGCLAHPDDWYVRYSYGTPPPPDGEFVAAIFACQVALTRCGGESCLPQRMKQIVREGVRVDFADPLEFLDGSKVGVYEVDLWLQSVNPDKLKRSASVYRADGPTLNNQFTG